MVIARVVLASLAAVASVSALHSEDHFFATLLKRQEPGTPAYNCHDNCGLAITLSRESGTCENQRFLGAYANCIQCSGPDNYNIWRYYGTTLSRAGETCGLETTPKSGKQPDVPPAGSSGQPGASSSSSPPEPPSTPSPTPEPTPEVPETTPGAPSPTTGGQEPSPSASVATSGAPESSAVESTGAGSPSSTGSLSESPVEYPVSSTSSVVVPVITPSASGLPHPSSNGTASFTASAPPQQTVNAAAGLEVSGMLGAVVLGLMFGLGN